MGRVQLTENVRRVRRPLLAALVALVAVQSGLLWSQPASAAGSGTISPSTPSIAWDFMPVGGPSGSTDSFALTVQLPQAAALYYAADARVGTVHAAVLTVTMTWTGSDTTQALTMAATDAGGTGVGNATGSTNNDGSDVSVFTLQDPLEETYTITAENFDGNSPTAIGSHAVATLQFYDLASQPEPSQPANGTGYDLYHIPLSLMPPTTEETQVLGGRAFGEPSIGIDTSNDAVMYQAGLYTVKTTFNTATTPPTPTFSDVSDAPLTQSASLDAILDVDRNTGRTLVSQLSGACSIGAVSDNDGASWTPSPHPCQVPAGPDHQTIGAGPFHAPLPQGAVYPDAVYYCSQSVATASCALSLDGGLDYGAASPMWTSDQCFGLHGHVKISPATSPDAGTVYVPNKMCGSPECLIVTSTAGPNCHPGFAVSTDNGGTWTVHTINDGHSRLYNSGDPSLGVGAQGTMYFGYGDRDGHPKIAVCTQQGTQCSASVDVGAAFHIESTEMPTVVAGDDNRAAFAFLGSTTPGDDQEQYPLDSNGKPQPGNTFFGTWHLYVAVTYDGGASWTTSDATPDAPIERGCIEFTSSCPSSRGSDDQRNLLDFNDLTTDSKGRIYAAYTDGCQPELATPTGFGPCLTDATRLSGLPTEIEGPAFARQSCGLGLYAQFDPLMTACTAVVTPETPQAAALVLGGIALVGGIGVCARRRRRRATA